MLILLLVVFFLSGVGLAAQADVEDTELHVIHVRKNVYMLSGPGGNIAASIGPDGTLLVDSKFAPLADQIRAALVTLGGKKIEYIINTHFHGDHVGGNHVLARDVPIIAHTNVRQRLTSEPEFDQRYVPPIPAAGWPTLSFDTSIVLHFNGDQIKAMHFPHSHTDGDVAVFFMQANVVHMGDLFFNQCFPFVDLDYGGSVEGLVQTVGTILVGLDAEVQIIPGHGPLASRSDLQRYHRMLVETMTLVKGAITADKTLDQIKETELSEEWQDWNWPFVSASRWLEIVYWSVVRKHD